MNNKNTGKIFILLLITALLSCFSEKIAAQNFKAKTKILAVNHKGFYKIPITVGIRSIAKNKLEDLRIKDKNGTEIPYLFYEENPQIITRKFIPYVIQNQTIGDTAQYITIKNLKKEKLNNFILELNNAAAERKISISGSDDSKEWFAVKDEFYFSELEGDALPNNFKMLSFPLTDYRYYKIELINGEKQPLKILKAGYFETAQTIASKSFEPIDGINFTQKDSSDKHTYLSIKISATNIIDQITLAVSAPKKFHRSAIILYNGVNYPINFSSEKENNFDCKELFGANKLREILIIVNNEDNTPLLFSSARVYQSAVSIIAELDAENHYYLYFGDSNLTAPTYDLVYFKNTIPKEIETTGTDAVEDISKSSVVLKSIDNSKYWVWIGLAFAAIAIGFMTRKMILDMKRNNED